MPDEGRTPRDFVFKGLELISEPLSAYVESRLRVSFGESWLSEARQRHERLHANNGHLNRDVNMLLQTINKCWDPAFRRALGRTERAHVNELIDVRNRHAHHEPFSDDEAERALSTMVLLMRAIGEETIANELKKMRAEILSSGQQPPPEPPAPVWVNSPPPQPPIARHRLHGPSGVSTAMKMSG